MSSEVVDVLTGEVLSGDLIHELDELEARSLTDRIVHSTTLAAQLVAEAWQGRAWKALGYKSWESYADAELPMLGSNSSNRHVLLVGLRNVGMSTRAISAVTGLGVGTVHRHTSGVPDGTPDEMTTGTDGKQYPSKVRRTETIEFMGDAAVGDAAESETSDLRSSPTFDPGEAALGDDAESLCPPSPESPTSDDGHSTPHGADLSDQAGGTGASSAAPPADPRPLLHRQVKAATVLFTAWKPEQIHALNDPELTRSFELLLPIVGDWFEEFTRTEPTGLTVIEGGRQ